MIGFDIGDSRASVGGLKKFRSQLKKNKITVWHVHGVWIFRSEEESGGLNSIQLGI